MRPGARVRLSRRPVSTGSAAGPPSTARRHARQAHALPNCRRGVTPSQRKAAEEFLTDMPFLKEIVLTITWNPCSLVWDLPEVGAQCTGIRATERELKLRTPARPAAATRCRFLPVCSGRWFLDSPSRLHASRPGRKLGLLPGKAGAGWSGLGSGGW